jgi:hypothetical protein
MTHTSESFKANLKHFEAPNPDNDREFARLDPHDQETHLFFVKCANRAYANARKNGIPEDYRAVLDYYRDLEGFKRINQGLGYDAKSNAYGVLSYEDIYARDTAISRTIYRSSVFEQLKVPIKTMGSPKWQIKQYRLTAEERPQITNTFHQPNLVRFYKGHKLTEGVGLQLGVALGWQEMQEAQGGLWDHMAILQSHASEIFGVTKSRMSFRGVDFYKAQFADGSKASDVGRTGLLNDANHQTFEAGDLTNLDDVVTGDGEVHDSIFTGLNDLDPSRLRQDHKKYIVSSRGIFGETLLETHRDSYKQKTDLQRIHESYFMTGMLDGWLITDQVYHDPTNAAITPAVAAQDMWILAIGPDLVNMHVIYPTQILPMNDKEFVDDFKEMIIYAQACQFMHVDTTVNVWPGTVAADVTTLTTGAMLREGMVNLSKHLGQAFA